MNNIFCGPIAAELHGFLQFKRDLGYGYRRAEFTLREFDRFLIQYASQESPLATGSSRDQLAVEQARP